MNVLSLFDGISCARVALDRAGIPVETYTASEIDRYAQEISRKNWGDVIQAGDVRTLKIIDMEVDLLIGGSPCQDLSIAKKDRKGLDGDRSGLFWEYVRILGEAKPKYFLLENVSSMSQSAKETITKTLGVQPIMINANLVSAQNRKRLFWTNIPGVTQPEDRGVFLKDIIENGYSPDSKSLVITSSFGKKNEQSYFNKSDGQMIADNETIYQYRRTYWRETKGGKVPTLTANMGTVGHNVPFILQTPRGRNPGGPRALDGKTPVLTGSSWEHNNKLIQGEKLRKLSPIECERLQGLPDDYTNFVSNTQRYKSIGNAFNVDVVAHILSFIPKG